MTLLEKVSVCIAIPSTLVLIVQFVLTLIGIGDGADSDFDVDNADFDGEADFGEGFGFHFFSFRGLVAFFAVMGWTGYALLSNGVKEWLSIVIAVAAGLLMMALVALAFYYMSKLQSSGNIDIRNAIGKSGTVYMTVPANRGGSGKINAVVQEKYGEFDAVTDENVELKFGCEVEIIGIASDDVLVVKKKVAEANN